MNTLCVVATGLGEERKQWSSNFTFTSEQSEGTINTRYQGVASIDVSPDGEYLASAGHDATLRIWKIENCKLLKVIGLQLVAPTKNVITQFLTTRFSPDGRWLTAGSYDGAIRLWEFDQISAPKESMTLVGHVGPIWTTIFDSSGKLLVSSDREGTIKLWKPFELEKEFATIKAHKGTAYSVDFSPDGKMLVSGGEDHLVKIWDVTTLQKIREIIAPGRVKSVHFSSDGNLIGAGMEISSGGFSSPLMVWEVTTGKVRHRFMENNDMVTTIAMHPNRKEMASGNDEHNQGTSIKIWDLEKGTLLQTLRPSLTKEHKLIEENYATPSPRESLIRALRYYKNGQALLSGSYDFTPWLWNLKTGKIEKVFRLQGCTP